MGVDPKKLGETAAVMMDELDIDGEIEEVLIIVAIRPTNQDEHGEAHIRIKCSNDRGYVQSGLLRAASVISEMGWEAPDDEEDDER
jgi:hypothetical protein